MNSRSTGSSRSRILMGSAHDRSISSLPTASSPSPRCKRTNRTSFPRSSWAAASRRYGTDMDLSLLVHREHVVALFDALPDGTFHGLVRYDCDHSLLEFFYNSLYVIQSSTSSRCEYGTKLQFGCVMPVIRRDIFVSTARR